MKIHRDRRLIRIASLGFGMALATPGLGEMARPARALPKSAAASITSGFSPREGLWHIAWPGRLSQHDVVYLSPPEDPSLGLPIGNGDLGALLWTTDRELILAINKCDAWDDGKAGDFANWGREEEENATTLRHAGRLIIDFGCPVFDLLYQEDFQARIELAPARVSLRAATPFAAAAVSAFVSAGHRVLVLRGEAAGSEGFPRQIRLEHWGSRVFGHWYSQIVRDAARGLDGTAAAVQRTRIVITQKLRTLSLVLAAQVVVDSQAAVPRRLHARAGSVDLPADPKIGFTVFITAVTSENAPDPVAEAHRILDRAVDEGEAAIRRAHEAEWKEFWSKSMVDLPNKYLESYWYLNLYLANSESRGASPPLFCNALWGWNRDFVPWVHYFHWNMQWLAWPLYAADHPELASPYLRYRRTQLPLAVQYAANRLHRPGAFYADVAERRGYNDREVDQNRTPGSQIALDFWRHYAFTGDEAFLRESAWPVIREVTRFHAATLKADAAGTFHVGKAQAYEGSPLFEDPITELAMIRALFPVAVRAGKMLGHDPAEIARWQGQLDHLAPLRLVDLQASEYALRGGDAFHLAGLAPGKPLASRRVFAVGRDEKGQWARQRYAGREEAPYYGFPDPEICPVVPAGVIGLGQRGSELFAAAVTQLRLHPKAEPKTIPGQAATMSGSGALCMGWCPYPIALARLGLAEELASELVNSVSTWQFYPQGFGHYGPYPVFKAAHENRWLVNPVRDAAKAGDKTFPFPAWPFRHFDQETMPIVASAINEMLLQSYEGLIRVCPSVPKDWDVKFDLAAEGGFRISAERAGGKLQWVFVESRLGRPCRLAHPWPEEGPLVCLDLGSNPPRRVVPSEESRGGSRVLGWETAAGHRYLLVRRESDLESWRISPFSPRPAAGPRHLGDAVLGRDRLY